MNLMRQIARSSSITRQVWSPFIIGIRNKNIRNKNSGYYRLYPEWHLTPISSKDELARLEAEGKLEAMKSIPVKPAPSTMTDSIFDDAVLKHFTNMVMQWAERTLARKLMHETFTRIKRIQLKKYHVAPEEERDSIELNPLVIFKQAIQNCQPVLGLMPIKKGGITYQVPVPITSKKSEWMAMKWLIMAARDKDGTISFEEQMTKELLDAYKQEGRVIKRKHDLHKVCENNKAYAHFRWS